MKKHFKIILAIVLTIILSTFSLNAGIVEATENAEYETQPRLTYISSLVAGFNYMGNLGTSTMTCRVNTNYRTELVLIMQQSSNNSVWTNFRTWVVQPTTNTVFAYEGDAFLSKGFYYRTSATINVYNGSALLETVTASSTGRYYS